MINKLLSKKKKRLKTNLKKYIFIMKLILIFIKI